MARKKYPAIGLVSVYRTLEKLEELHLIQRVHQPSGCQAFISACHGHQHLLLCQNCGQVTFFEGDDLDAFFQTISTKDRLPDPRTLAAIVRSVPGLSITSGIKEYEPFDRPFDRFHTPHRRMYTRFLLTDGSDPSDIDFSSTTFLADIARNVAGDRVKVESLLPIGADPHSYQPTPQDAAKIADSRLLIVNGMEYEHFIESLLENAGGERMVVTASDGIEALHAEEHAGRRRQAKVTSMKRAIRTCGSTRTSSSPTWRTSATG